MRDHVKNERQRRGWSFANAGRAGGVSYETWRQYESTANLTRRMLRAITQAFDWPFGWQEEPTLPQSAEPIKPSQFAMALSSAATERGLILDELRVLRSEVQELREWVRSLVGSHESRSPAA